MKRWTVMVVPQGQGTTRTWHISTLHTWLLYGAAAVVIVIAFAAAFFFQRYRVAQQEVAQLREVKLQNEFAPQEASSDRTELTADERAELERKIREEYERRNSKILTELSELYDIEAEIRTLHGLPPRETAQTTPIGGKGGGKGGGPSMIDGATAELAEVVRPPSLIYGLSNPSADLLVQEIMMRKESLHELVSKMEGKRDRVERTPSIWPCTHPSRRITSTFGTRRDPITKTFRHHDGTDISAVSGSPVVATAKGKIVEADYHRFFGNLVKIDHGNGVQSWYAHLRSFSVQQGDRVERGQPIGTVGSTGRATGAHVHYEIHVNGRPVDSGTYLANR